MITVTILVSAGIAVRALAYWDEPATPALALVLTLAAAALTFLGGTLGGSLAYDYGFNVETAGDHPVWHQSETDVLPGHRHTACAGTSTNGHARYAPAAEARPSRCQPPRCNRPTPSWRRRRCAPGR